MAGDGGLRAGGWMGGLTDASVYAGEIEVRTPRTRFCSARDAKRALLGYGERRVEGLCGEGHGHWRVERKRN